MRETGPFVYPGRVVQRRAKIVCFRGSIIQFLGDNTLSDKPLPVVEYLKIPDDGDPYLEGYKCGACGTTFLGHRAVCSKCGARDQMSVVKLPNKGKLYTFSIVHRSFPGIDVPYVSAVVDLDDGTAIKGNLINVEPDPAKIEFGMPVDVVFGDALGRKDRDGNSYLSFFFQPSAA
jgi:hypothetical protein